MIGIAQIKKLLIGISQIRNRTVAISQIESEFNEFEPRLKSAKNRFQLNRKTLNRILSGTNHI